MNASTEISNQGVRTDMNEPLGAYERHCDTQKLRYHWRGDQGNQRLLRAIVDGCRVFRECGTGFELLAADGRKTGCTITSRILSAPLRPVCYCSQQTYPRSATDRILDDIVSCFRSSSSAAALL